MKKNRYIMEALLQATLVATILLFASCDNNQKQEGSKDVAEERNNEKFDNNKHKKDAEFLVKAAEINLKEIHFGQLAQQKGKTDCVKELGKTMEDAHSKSQKDLITLAKSKSIDIPSAPTEDSNDTYTKLNEKSGVEFDKAYVEKMVSEHKDAIKVFEEASEDSNDNNIKNWAKNTLPDLRKHLNQSIECQKKL